MYRVRLILSLARIGLIFSLQYLGVFFLVTEHYPDALCFLILIYVFADFIYRLNVFFKTDFTAGVKNA